MNDKKSKTKNAGSQVEEISQFSISEEDLKQILKTESQKDANKQ